MGSDYLGRGDWDWVILSVVIAVLAGMIILALLTREDEP